MGFIARLPPANMEPVLATFARAYIATACPNVELHTDWLVGLPELDLAIRLYHYLSFSFAFRLPSGPLRSLSSTTGLDAGVEEVFIDAALGVVDDDADPPGEGIMWY